MNLVKDMNFVSYLNDLQKVIIVFIITVGCILILKTMDQSYLGDNLFVFSNSENLFRQNSACNK